MLGRVSYVLARRKAPHVPSREAELLKLISRHLPEKTLARYRELNTKLHNEVITELEHQEFLALVDQIEMADAKRLEYLIELAQLRDESLETLMEQVGLRLRSSQFTSSSACSW